MYRFSPRSYTDFVANKPRYAIRLEDVSLDLILSGQCQRCRHLGDIDRGSVFARWGRRSFMVDLDKRLRCTSCRSRGYNTLVVTGRLERQNFQQK